MQEIWKDIKGYEGLYQVSSFGKVKSLRRSRLCKVNKGTVAKMTIPEKILKQWRRSKNGYLLVDLWKDKKRAVKSVHVLVYETFIGKIEEKRIIHHIDKNKENNNIDNLCQLSILEHNRLHTLGRDSWNKGLSLSESRPEIYKKMWETRRKKATQK